MRFPTLAPVLLLVLGRLSAVAGAAPLDFNRDIRPILSDKCFRCHGPDEAERKGGDHGLRLDTREGAITELGGGAHALVPGKPAESELIRRLLTTDEDDIMPPVKTGKVVTAAERAVLERWISEGAPYAKHWSYEPPRRPELPRVKDAAWARNAVDRFVLARLEQAGLQPQPEADRLALARRVALDLTGLPPSVAEADAFVKDARPDAYERFVDAQLAKPAYGEHWARLWLDLARYADSKGYADDQPRSIWRYRDWVINAFNRNLPFDQFTIEQLAGDMLPNPTEEQLVATGFHRNTMNNTEGGTDDEEFRSVAVVDRVNTTFAVWMGTSMACAQCHTHKYDPISHREYFQAYALLNQTADADRNDEAPLLEFFTAEQQQRRAGWEQEIAALHRQLDTLKPKQVAAARLWAKQFAAPISWQHPLPAHASTAAGAAPVIAANGDVSLPAAKGKGVLKVEYPDAGAGPIRALRIETPPQAGEFVVTRIRVGVKPGQDSKPARYVRLEMPGTDRNLPLAEVQVFGADGVNLATGASAKQSSTLDGAVAERAIDGRTDGNPDHQSVSVTAAEENPWWELDLGNAQLLSRIVVWGRTGAEPTTAGLRLTLLDEQHNVVWEQVAREAPRPKKVFALTDPVDVKLGRVVADFAQADLDESLINSDQEPKLPNRRKRGAERRGWGVAGGGDGAHWVAVELAQPLTLAPRERIVVTVEQQMESAPAVMGSLRMAFSSDSRVVEHLRLPTAVIAALALQAGERGADAEDAILTHYLRSVAPETAKERRRIATLRQSLDDLMPSTTPIMRELPLGKQRKTHVQLRGNFRALAEEVSPGVPAVFGSLPAGVPPDRLALARWLVARENPLTARVLANRYWEAIFGLGLVRTVEEFGSQGEAPSHPELLDWLAMELMDHGWDTKALVRQLVTSAAYRQSTKVTPEALEADPENRLLSRGPRFRLVAETVRDQALAVSGLLSPKLLGPSGRPFQPSSGLKAAFGATLDWKASEGEDRLRRGLYTEWRRSSPYPSMATFDAPNREVCTLRRGRTNTPLQALVTLNDPVYLEAAQALAKTTLAGAGTDVERLTMAFRRVLIRPPRSEELSSLSELLQRVRAGYTSAPDRAAQFVGMKPAKDAPVPAEAVELAAWTAVGNVLLNLDETLMKR